MSERDNTPITSEPPISPKSPPRGARARLRRFFFRHLPLTAAIGLALLSLIAVGLYLAASSAAFENVVRKRLIAEIDNLTGGQAQIASFHWRLLHLEAQADGVVIHGLEDPGEVPYAQIESLRVQVSVLGFVTPRVLLRDLEVIRPSLHFIVYPDGSTNQPRPRRPGNGGKSPLETLFNLQAGHVAVEQGVLNYDNRAAAFDYRNRFAPLDFEADDVSLAVHYVLAAHGAPELYRIEAGAKDLNLSRDVPRKKTLRVHGTMQTTLDLERERLSLRSLMLTAHSSGTPDHTLQIAGVLEDFSHPRWQAKVAGDLDMQLLEPLTGYPDASVGIAHLDLVAGGMADEFHIDGGVHVDGGAYKIPGVVATGINLDAQVHADPRQLLITQIVARLRQGGQIEGTVDLQPWLPGPSAPRRSASVTAEGDTSGRNVLVRIPPVFIPVNGKVTANFHDVSLDAVLDMVSMPPYRRLGIATLLNGPAEATWSKGDDRTVAVTAAFGMSPSARPPAGESPASGVIDATYVQRNGAVDLRKLELHLPGSELEAHGTLGAYPVKSPSALNVGFHSRNLAEFDAVLRSLGLARNGKTGTAALPVALAGQADFQGSWTGSLVRPHLAGNLKAANLAIEIPAAQGSTGPPQFVRMDSVEAVGSYSPAQIAIQHAQLLRGNTRIVLNGTLEAIAGWPASRRCRP